MGVILRRGRKEMAVSLLLGVGWLLVGCCCYWQRWRDGGLRVLALMEVGGVRRDRIGRRCRWWWWIGFVVALALVVA